MGKFQTAPARRAFTRSRQPDSRRRPNSPSTAGENGDWGILNGLNDRIEHFPIKVKTLATNRRSETNIIRFNNQIFTAAVNYLNEVYKKQLGKDCDDLQKAYADVVQESPRSVQKGYVKATFLEPDEAHDYTDQTLISLGEEVEHLPFFRCTAE